MTVVRRAVYDDLMALPDDGYRHELVRGEIRRMPPPKGQHGHVEAAVVEAIGRYLHGRALAQGWQESDGLAARDRLVGYVGSGEHGIRFDLPDDPDQVRGVDVLFLTPDQYARHAGALAEDYIPEVPALCVEIISPTQSAEEVDERVGDYLTGGAQMVWCLFPRRRTVTVYTPDQATQTIRAGGMLSGGEVLPGLAIPLTLLFP
jgi:Uma2 family endonuclease